MHDYHPSLESLVFSSRSLTNHRQNYFYISWHKFIIVAFLHFASLSQWCGRSSTQIFVATTTTAVATREHHIDSRNANRSVCMYETRKKRGANLFFSTLKRNSILSHYFHWITLFDPKRRLVSALFLTAMQQCNFELDANGEFKFFFVPDESKNARSL